MESVNNVLRFHHISKLVFECLDDKSLIKSALVCRAWRHFLHSEKFFWIRVINGHRSGWVKFIEDFVHTKKVNSETFCALGKSFLNYHLESKLMPNPFVENGLHPMFAAIYLDDLEIFSTLRKLYPDFMKPFIFKGLSYQDVYSLDRISPFGFAAMSGSVKIVFWFLENSGYRDRKAIGDFAYEYGYDEDDEDGTSPLFLALRYNQTKIVKILSKVSEPVRNERNRCGVTLLHLAARRGNLQLARSLCKAISVRTSVFGGFGNSRDEYGVTPLHEAAKNGHTSIVELIINQTSNLINPADEFDETPLHLASKFGHLEVVKLILAKLHKSRGDKNPGAEFKNWCTPLHLASYHGHLQIVKEFLSFGDIDLNRKNGDGRTPLHFAAKRGHLEIVREFLDHFGLLCYQKKLSQKDRLGRTPLLIATRAGQTEIVKLLLSQMTRNYNSKDKKGRTPLHEAARNGHIEIVELLLGKIKRKNLNPKDKFGRTPLGLAIDYGHYEAYEILNDKFRGDEGQTENCSCFRMRRNVDNLPTK